ncbi:unnamed protein product [Linum tenue]|uniref:ZF-HD dimerization-type domain-containing protein n=1 Tax=Linum tenue TaxID=586396 RepID=A0AAV0MP31_9ROSI|nr:unnamed protein product [Linum tenue]
MPQEPRRRHGRPCSGRLRRVHARTRCFPSPPHLPQMRRLRLPPQFPPPPPFFRPWTTHHHHRHSSSPSPGQTSSGGAPSPTPSPPGAAAAASPTPHHSVYPSAPQMLLALSSAAGEPLCPGDSNPHYRNQAVQNANLGEMGSLRKRARTRFTPEQKARMQDFAEKLGWKMLRGKEDKIVGDFCSQIGVRRNVFKVWMHNNKHRKDKGSNGNNHNHHNSNSGGGGGGGNGNIGHEHFDDDGDEEEDDEEEEEEDDDNGNHHVVSVKYDLNGTIGDGGNYEGRVRFDTNVFESKVHLHGPSAAAAAAATAAPRSSPSY